jgi:hypothetical protein
MKGNDNGCANISISLNLQSVYNMQVNLFDTIQTSRKIVYTSIFVTLTAFVDNVLSLFQFGVSKMNELSLVSLPYLSSRTLGGNLELRQTLRQHFDFFFLVCIK